MYYGLDMVSRTRVLLSSSSQHENYWHSIASLLYWLTWIRYPGSAICIRGPIFNLCTFTILDMSFISIMAFCHPPNPTTIVE